MFEQVSGQGEAPSSGGRAEAGRGERASGDSGEGGADEGVLALFFTAVTAFGYWNAWRLKR
jgi:hypothetical protein